MSTLFQREGDADYSARAIRLNTPVPSGLQLLLYIGALDGDTPDEAAARSVRNLSGGSHSASIVGSPTIDTGYAEFTNLTAYIQTTVPETESFTHMACCYPNDTLASTSHQPAYVSNLGADTVNGNFQGTLLWMHTSTLPSTNPEVAAANTSSAGTLQGGANTFLASAINPWTTMKLISGKVDAGTMAYTIRNLTDGTKTTATKTGTRRLHGDGNLMRIGSTYHATGGIGRVGIVALWNRCLTDQEEDDMRAFFAIRRLGVFGEVI